MPVNEVEQSRREPRPRSLVVSFFGIYGRELGGWVAVSDLIRLLAELDVDESSTRVAVSRLKRRGLLKAQRLGGVAGYALSSSARAMLAEGDRRIYQRRVAELTDGWVLAVFSVPESERNKRHLLRSQLVRLGFGTAASGVWVAPVHVYDETRAVLRRLGFAEHVNLFKARYLGFAELRDTVRRWWDFDKLNQMYAEYVRAYEPVLAAWNCVEIRDYAAAFVDHLRAADAWRRMPYLDPGLPQELVPDDWAGAHAADIFFGLHTLLADSGLTHVHQTIARRGWT